MLLMRWYLLLVILLGAVPTAHSQGDDGEASGNLFGIPRCLLNPDRCFYGFLQSMHRIDETTGNCEEICVLFPIFHFSYNCGLCPLDNDRFDIDFGFEQIPESDRRYFTDAKAFWETVIVGDKPMARADLNAKMLMGLISDCPIPDRVDDLFICASYSKIDGSIRGQDILGFAAPLVVRNGLPAYGIMQFDGADIVLLKQTGDKEFGELILHEMAHVLGIGAMFTLFGDLADNSEGLCVYQGENGNAEYRALTGCDGSLPTDVASCGHLNEECFPTELMGPFADVTKKDIVSRLSIATLKDVGYEVNFDVAGNYTREDVNASCTCDDGRRRSVLEEQPLSAQRSAHRRIREETYQYAHDHGRRFLARIVEASSSLRPLPVEMGTIGRIVSVLVKDDDGIHRVVVNADD